MFELFKKKNREEELLENLKSLAYEFAEALVYEFTEARDFVLTSITEQEVVGCYLLNSRLNHMKNSTDPEHVQRIKDFPYLCYAFHNTAAFWTLEPIREKVPDEVFFWSIALLRSSFLNLIESQVEIPQLKTGHEIYFFAPETIEDKEKYDSSLSDPNPQNPLFFEWFENPENEEKITKLITEHKRIIISIKNDQKINAEHRKSVALINHFSDVTLLDSINAVYR
mgnify:CR=1 FL=1